LRARVHAMADQMNEPADPWQREGARLAFNERQCSPRRPLLLSRIPSGSR
jgi:hypothetical protein